MHAIGLLLALNVALKYSLKLLWLLSFFGLIPELLCLLVRYSQLIICSHASDIVSLIMSGFLYVYVSKKQCRNTKGPC